MFDDAALALAAAHWPGPLTLVVPLRPDARIAVAGHRRPADDRAARARRTRRCRRCSRRRPAARRAVGQCQRRDQPDPRRACAAQPRRPDPADHRRRRRPSAASNRPSSPRPAGRCACCGRGPIDVDGRSTRCGERDRGAGPARQPLCAVASRCGSTRPSAGDGRISDRLRRRRGDASLSAAGDLVEAAARLFDLLHRADAVGQAAHRRRAGPGRRPRRRDQRPPEPSARRARRCAARSSPAPGSSCAASAAWAG